MRVPRSEALVCLLLGLIVGAAYHPVLGHGFVSLDDEIFVVRNPMVNEGLTAAGVRLAFIREHSSNWIPLTWLSHALDTTLFGLDPGAHHGVNVLLHALNACLLFLVLRRMTDPARFWSCAAVAALFAVHPAHVETVAWISERKGTLSTTFWWLTIWAYVRHVHRPSPGRLAWVCVAMALGLLAKGMLITLPLVLLLLDHWPLRRLAAAERHSARGRQLGDLVVEKLPLFALALLSALTTFLVQKSGGAIHSIESVPVAERLANAVLAYSRYLGILFWPHELAVLHPRLDGEALAWLGPVGASAALLLAITGIVLRLGRAHPYLPVGWLWYLGTLLPVIGLVQVGSHSIAERYTYVPYVGLWILLVWSAGSLWARTGGRGWQLALLPSLLVLVCIAGTRSQVRHWRSSIALWQRAVAVSPDNTIAHDQLAHVLLQANRLDEALDHARRAVALAPDSVSAHHNLGSVLLRRGRNDAAGSEFFRALQVDPNFAPSQVARALVLHDQGSYARAVELFEAALGSSPELWKIAGARFRYGDSLRRELRSRQVGFEQAVEDHRRALRLEPDWPEVERNLAWILATDPRAGPEHAREALEHARRAAGAGEHRSVAELDTLAAAYAAAGDFEQAVALARTALERASAAGHTLVAEEIRGRMAGYRAGRPHREDPR